eukprot:tig00001487_g8946.t1
MRSVAAGMSPSGGLEPEPVSAPDAYDCGEPATVALVRRLSLSKPGRCGACSCSACGCGCHAALSLAARRHSGGSAEVCEPPVAPAACAPYSHISARGRSPTRGRRGSSRGLAIPSAPPVPPAAPEPAAGEERETLLRGLRRAQGRPREFLARAAELIAGALRAPAAETAAGRAFALCALAAAGPDAPPSGVLTARPPLLLPPFLTGQRQVFFRERAGREGALAAWGPCLCEAAEFVAGGIETRRALDEAAGAQAGLLASTALFKARLERRARDQEALASISRTLLAHQAGEGLEELCSRSAAALGPILRVHRVFVWDYTDASYASGAGYPRGAWTSPAIFAPGGPRERVGERLEKLEAPVVRALAAALDESPEGVFRCGSVGEALLRAGPLAAPGLDLAAWQAEAGRSGVGRGHSRSLVARAAFQGAPQGRPSPARPAPAAGRLRGGAGAGFVCVSVEGARGPGAGRRGAPRTSPPPPGRHQLGVAMAHARLVARFREQNARLEAQLNYSRLFQAITREIHQARGVREVFEIGARMVREALRCSRCRVTCLDDFSLDARAPRPAPPPLTARRP